MTENRIQKSEKNVKDKFNIGCNNLVDRHYMSVDSFNSSL
jgi:hypothetical protein